MDNIEFESLDGLTEINEHDIAIIGISLRLPQADTLEELWDNLKIGRNCINDIPEERMEDIKGYMKLFGKADIGKMPKAAYLKRIDTFDYKFFHMSPKQAQLMDPHHRIFLETAWNAFEDAGYGGNKTTGEDIGVYVGFNPRMEYKRMIMEAKQATLADALTGSLPSALAGMVSYLMDLQGPNVNINTACSSSLVALHMACQAIRNKECKMALTGSVRLSLMPDEDMESSDIGIASSDGKAKVFDDDADGSTGGEGAIAVLLKPLSQAVEDRDHIYAVIKGSGINSDGRSASLTSPNALAQTRAIKKAWKDAGVSPETITYIETHGTGTGLGDPIEIEGLRKAFAEVTSRKQFCAVGSVKTNLGHLDTAAGILGVVKVICAMNQKMIPPSLHFQVPSRKIDFEDTALYVCNRLTSWDTGEYPRRCGVTSFGLSGTNAHVILEETQQGNKRREKDDVRLLVLSADTKKALGRMIESYRNFICCHPQCHIDDICFTANTGRGMYQYRIAFVFTSRADLLDKMDHVTDNLNMDFVAEGILFQKANEQEVDERKQESVTECLRNMGKLKDLEEKKSRLEQMGKLYVEGLNITWDALYERKRCYRVSLPGYPFEATRCWIDLSKCNAQRQQKEVEKASPDTKVLMDQIEVCLDEADSVSEDAIQIAKIWGYHLGYHRIHISDNYFQLGGDSIQALKIVNSVNEILQTHIKVADLLKYPVISQLADIVVEKRDMSQDNVIACIEKQEYYDLSDAQTRIYFACMFEGETVRYNLTNGVILEGVVDYDRLESALQKIVERHEILRTTYHLVDGVPKMQVKDKMKLQIERVQIEENDIEAEIYAFRKPFHLESGPLLRIRFLILNDRKMYLLYDVHHIVFDSYSFGVVMDDLVKLYMGQPLQELRIQYKDYAAWHLARLETDNLKKQEEYWLSQFQGDIPYSVLRTDKTFSSQKVYTVESLWFHMDAESGLKNLIEQSDTTMFMLLLSILGVLVSQYLEQNTVVIGSPIAGRNHPEVENLIGDFINLLAIKVEAQRSLTFTELLGMVKENCLRAYENQDYPFQNLVKKLNIKENQLFNVLFAFHSNLKKPSNETDSWKIYEGEYDVNAATYDITLDAEETEEGIRFNLSYSKELFAHEFIEQLIANYCHIASQIAGNPDIRIEEIELLDVKLKEHILQNLGVGETCPVGENTILNMFQEAYRKYPDKDAVIGNQDRIQYRELQNQAQKLARVLACKGVKNNQAVGFMLRRNSSLIVTMVGILKAGAAYVPIDLTFPKERIQYILQDSQIEYLICEEEIVKEIDLPITEYEIIYIDRLEQYETAECVIEDSKPDDIAYILYTSGSTGKPKGVMVRHRELYNFVLAMEHSLNLSAKKSILALTTVSFDIFELESVVALASGLSIVLADENHQNDIYKLADYVMQTKLEIIQATPSRISMFLEYDGVDKMLSSVQLLLIGGEKLDRNLLNRLKSIYKGKIYNMYGPTETTIWSSVKELTHEEEVTVGRPVTNTTFYVLGKDLKLRPVGCPGELYIGGLGVAKGYLHNDELTKERFIPNPYVPSERIYKTGDLARWLPNGDLEVLGRNDNQVKLNGHRIELGEIEAAVLEVPFVQEAVVLKWDEEDRSYLCCYFTGTQTVDIEDIKEHIQSKLPRYMVPKFYMQLEAFPLTQNEKIDRKRLKQPKSKTKQVVSEKENSTELEKKLIDIWSTILHTDEIGIHDNFFDLGGDSLLLVQLQSEIKKKFNFKLDVTEFFENSTIAKLAAILDREEKQDAQVSLKCVRISDRYLSYQSNNGKMTHIFYAFSDEQSAFIIETAQNRQRTISEWLLGIFVYHLSSVVTDRKVAFVTNIKNRKKLTQIDLEIKEEITKDEELKEFVLQYARLSDDVQDFNANEIANSYHRDEQNELSAGFLFHSPNLMKELQSMLDIGLEVTEESGKLTVNLHYSGKLSKQGAKILLSQYIKLVLAITKLF